MTTLVTPSDLRARAKKLFDRDARTWAAEQQTDVVLDVPLRPPTEREALDDLNRVRQWVDAWRGVSEDSAIELEWVVRNWSRSEVLERLLDVVFVDGVARGGEHVVLTLPPALSVLEQIREESASVRSRLLKRDLALVEELHNGRAAHVQEIRCLLGGEPCCLGYN